jgi:hypothetical protein
VVGALIGQRHFDRLKIEKPDEAIVAGGDQEENLLFRSLAVAVRNALILASFKRIAWG